MPFTIDGCNLTGDSGRASTSMANSPVATALSWITRENVADNAICAVCHKIGETKKMRCSHDICNDCVVSAVNGKCALCAAADPNDFSTVLAPSVQEKNSPFQNAIRCSQAICSNNDTAKVYCADCGEFLCGVCTDAHSRVSAVQNHVMVKIPEHGFISWTHDSITCQFHRSMQMTLFCHVCKEMTCPICHNSLHQGHSFTDVKNDANMQREILTVVASMLPDKELSFRERINRNVAQIQKIDAARVEAKNNIRTAVHQLQDIVTRRVQCLAAEIDRRCELETSYCTSFASTANEMLVSTAFIKRLVSQIEQTASADALLPLLNYTFGALKRINDTASKCDSSLLERPVLSFSITTSHFAHYLENMGTFQTSSSSSDQSHQRMAPRWQMLSPQFPNPLAFGNRTTINGGNGRFLVPPLPYRSYVPAGYVMPNNLVHSTQMKQNRIPCSQPIQPRQQYVKPVNSELHHGSANEQYQWSSCCSQPEISPASIYQLPIMTLPPTIDAFCQPNDAAVTVENAQTPPACAGFQEQLEATAIVIGHQSLDKSPQDLVSEVLNSIKSPKKRQRQRRGNLMGKRNDKVASSQNQQAQNRKRRGGKTGRCATKNVRNLGLLDIRPNLENEAAGKEIANSLCEFLNQMESESCNLDATSGNIIRSITVGQVHPISVECGFVNSSTSQVSPVDSAAASPNELRLVIDESDSGVESAIVIEESPISGPKDDKLDIMFEELIASTSISDRGSSSERSSIDACRLELTSTSTPANQATEKSFWDELCCVCDTDDGRPVRRCACGRVYHSNHHVPMFEEGALQQENNWLCTICATDSEKTCNGLFPESKESINAHEQKACERILLELMTSPDSIYFHEPVDKSVTAYFKLIKTPMDFSCINQRLTKRQYSKVEQFISDMNKVFVNGYIYYKGFDRQICKKAFTIGRTYHELINKHFPDMIGLVRLRPSKLNATTPASELDDTKRVKV